MTPLARTWSQGDRDSVGHLHRVGVRSRREWLS